MRWKHKGEEKFVTGGISVGFPVFPYGRAKHKSWGVTAANPDKSDLYVEHVRDGKYEYDG